MHQHKSATTRSTASAERAGKRNGGATAGALTDALNRTPAVQAQMALDGALNDAVQRKEEDDELLSQMKKEEDEIPQLKRNDTGLPDHVKSGVESLSGRSLDGVNVHYNSAVPAQLNALAYTQGQDIHVAPGQQQHVAHEAWHVVQQMEGRVEPTTSVNGVEVNDERSLEREADVMGARAQRATQRKEDGRE